MGVSTETRQEILATLHRFGEANSRGDAEAALAVFAPEGEVVLVGSEPGQTARGIDDIRAFLGRVLSRSSGYRWSWNSVIVSSAGTAAWIFAEGTAHAGTGRDASGVPYRASIVLEQQDGQWRWRLFHGSEPIGPSP